jgi:hypothetical protein
MNAYCRSLICNKLLILNAVTLSVIAASGCRQRHGGVSRELALQAVTPDEDSIGSFTVPAKEVSGLCVFNDANTGKNKVLAVSDSDKKLIVADLAGIRRGRLEAEAVDLSAWSDGQKPTGSAKSGSQWEAIFADNNSRLYISNEEAGTIEVFDFKKRRFLGQIELSFGSDNDQISELKKAWDQDTGSRVEGFVVLSNGHILAAKEKNPPALIEFAPRGEPAEGFAGRSVRSPRQETVPSTFVPWPGRPEKKLVYYAQKYWRPSSEFSADLDLSELTISDDGQIVLLSDRLRSIYFLGNSLTLAETTFKTRKTINLPAVMEKPEGLTFITAEQGLIAIDLKEIKTNLFLKYLK